MTDRRPALVRLALRAVPASWRETIALDLADEARRCGRSSAWCAMHALRVGFRLRPLITGDIAMTEWRHAVRSLLQARWFTLGAVLTFALGIGVNTAVFSAVDRMMFRTLPYADPDNLVLLSDCPPNAPGGQCSGSFPSAVAYEAQKNSQTLSAIGVAAFASPSWMTTKVPGDDRRLSLVSISPSLLSVLGVTPMLGRALSPEEAASSDAFAWLAHDVWKARFGGDPTVLGRPLYSSNTTATIVGVLPKAFIPPMQTGTPSQWDGLVVDRDSWATIKPNGGVAQPVARLRPGMSADAAQAEIDGMLRAWSADSTRAGQRKPAVRVARLSDALFSRHTEAMLMLVVPAALILAVACANLGSLLLARSRGRLHQAAIKTALGASRKRVVASALLECAIVCVAGGVLALVAIGATSKLLTSWIPPLFTRNAESAVDPRVLGFTLLAAVLSCLIAGLAPAMRLARADVRSLLHTSSRAGRRRWSGGGRFLLACEAAFGCALVLGAALTLRSIIKLTTEDLGVEPRGLYFVRVAPTTPPDPTRPRDPVAFHERATILMAQVPGVAAAGGGDLAPFTGAAPPRAFAAKLRIGAQYQATKDTFAALGMPMLAGRSFAADELTARAPVVVLSKSGLRYVWPDATPADAIGRQWQPEGEPARVVVGVVADIKQGYGDLRSSPIASYVTVGAARSRYGTIFVRPTAGASLDPALIRSRFEPEFGPVIVTVRSAMELATPDLLEPRFRAGLFGGLAAVGLLLLAAGLYAIASYEVAQQRYEMGIRLTLGADPASLQRRVIADITLPVIVGSAAGLVFSFWGAEFANAFLYRVDSRDPWTYAIVAMVLVASAMLAAWLPARRAARTDPAIVLRAQ